MALALVKWSWYHPDTRDSLGELSALRSSRAANITSVDLRSRKSFRGELSQDALRLGGGIAGPIRCVRVSGRAELEALYQRLNPLQLQRDLEAALHQFWALAAPDPHRPYRLLLR